MLETADNLARIWNYVKMLEETSKSIMIWNYDNWEFSCTCNYTTNDKAKQYGVTRNYKYLVNEETSATLL